MTVTAPQKPLPGPARLQGDLTVVPARTVSGPRDRGSRGLRVCASASLFLTWKPDEPARRARAPAGAAPLA